MDSTRLTCACGQVQLELEERPILTAECHCTSCRTAGERLGALPAARPLLEENGGTPFVLYRKDRVRFLGELGRLKEYRLGPGAKTRRVLATCCNTPVFLEFENGHWLSLYGSLWPRGTMPPIQMRTMTMDRTSSSPLPNDVPNSKRQSLAFFAKLVRAWIAMGFRSPKLDVVHGQLRV